MHFAQGEDHMNLATSRVRPFLVLSAALSLLLPLAATGAAIEEVIVTAQKREESIQDVGISISAFSAKQLEQLGVKNTVEVTQQVPGLQLFSYSPAFTVFSLRGVSQNNFQDNLEAPVAVYLDGAYVASMNALNMQLFDMERVEVLRGPQGTLFGRNATGGVIQFLTHKAVEEEANGYLEGMVGDFNAYSVEGAFGGAFSEDVRGRLSGRWEKSDGYVEPGSAFGFDATGRDTNGADGYALRGNLQIDASDNVLIDLAAGYAKDDDVPTGVYIVTFVGIDPVTGVASFNDAIDPATGDGPMDFPRTPITGDGFHHFTASDPFALSGDPGSPTGTLHGSRNHLCDRDDYGGPRRRRATRLHHQLDGDGQVLRRGLGRRVGVLPVQHDQFVDQVSQELRLSNSEGPFRWHVGAYYLDMTWDTFQSVQGAAILGGLTEAPAKPRSSRRSG